MWVIVNYSKKTEDETFFVSEEEEKNKKNDINNVRKFLKHVFPVFSFIFTVVKYL